MRVKLGEAMLPGQCLIGAPFPNWREFSQVKPRLYVLLPKDTLQPPFL